MLIFTALMTIFSAAQDFSEQTIPAISGALNRLIYVAGLRGQDGRYEHWGMLRVYGEAGTQSAIEEAHAAVLLEVLRTPVRQLDAEMRIVAAESVLNPNVNLQAERLLPEGASRAAALHLNSILLALDALARRRRQSTRQVA